MAGDWIKMRIDLQSHPKIVRILSATGADKFRVIGGLHAVWSVFDTHSEDGALPGYTPQALDHVIGWQGFSEAMIKVGWLEVNGPDSLILPEFFEHNGKSGKRRAEDQKRKREDRKNPQDVTEDFGQIADKLRTREEKRREEKIDTAKDSGISKITVSAKKYSPVGDLIEQGVNKQIAEDWIEVRRKKKAAPTQTAINAILEKILSTGMSLDAGLRLCCERGWAGFEPEWMQPNRAPPNSSQSDSQRRQQAADILTGRHRHAQPDLIDIN